MKTATHNSKKINKNHSTKTSKTVTLREPALFLGTLAATKVFKRTMTEFTNCKAYCWLLINEANNTYSFANSYNGETPKASFEPKHYTYDLSDKAQKLIDKKLADANIGYEEIEVTDWPAWITNAAGTKKTRKTSKYRD